MKRIHRFLERRLGGSLTWTIYGLGVAVLFRLVVLKQPVGEMFLDLVVVVGIIIVAIAAFKILQRRAKSKGGER